MDLRVLGRIRIQRFKFGQEVKLTLTVKALTRTMLQTSSTVSFSRCMSVCVYAHVHPQLPVYSTQEGTAKAVMNGKGAEIKSKPDKYRFAVKLVISLRILIKIHQMSDDFLSSQV